MPPWILSVRRRPELAPAAIAFFQKHWSTEASSMVYQDCIMSCLQSPSPLPQWYLLAAGPDIIGGAGLVTNDFISRMDLWPWLCALYVEEDKRGRGYGGLLVERVKSEARAFGYARLYLSTDLNGYYERYGFKEIGPGYHPWGESSNIFQTDL